MKTSFVKACTAGVALAACTPTPQVVNAPTLEACDSLEWSDGFEARECMLFGAADQAYRVTYAPMSDAGAGGQVSLHVSDSETLTETNVSEFHPPTLEDVDGDGALDVLIPIATGNANTAYALWRSIERTFVRFGEFSGVSFQRTVDGYLAVPARGGAADWSVAFYRVAETGLEPLVTVAVHGEADANGAVTNSTCTISEAPGLAALTLSEAQAQEKFCADPAAQVFGP